MTFDLKLGGDTVPITLIYHLIQVVVQRKEIQISKLMNHYETGLAFLYPTLYTQNRVYTYTHVHHLLLKILYAIYPCW